MTDAEFRKAVLKLRRQVSARIESGRRARGVAIDAVKDQNYWNSWAEISGAIGMTALISAGFLFAGALVAKGIGSLSAAIAEELMLATRGMAVRRAIVSNTVSAFSRLSQLFGRFATAGQGIKMTAKNAPTLIAASNGLIARLTVGGTSILLSEAFKSTSFRAEGIRFDGANDDKSDLKWRILTMVALAYIGRPGAPSDPVFLKFIGKLPDTKSLQATVQAANVFKELKKAAGRDDPLGVIWKDLGAQPEKLNAAITAAGNMTLEQLFAQAQGLEEDYLDFFFKKIKDKDYTAQFSWYTRAGMSGWPATFANIGTGSWLWGKLKFFNSEDSIDPYNYLCRTIIIEHAKIEFWQKVSVALETAIAEIKYARFTAQRRVALWRGQGWQHSGSGAIDAPIRGNQRMKDPSEMLR